MTLQEVKDRVLSILDENTPANSGLLNDVAEKPIEQTITSCLNPAWRELVLLAPVHLLPQKTETTQTSGVTPSIAVPSGLIRVTLVRAASWTKPARIILEDDPMYEVQFNEFARGSKNKPVAVLKDSSIDLFTCLESDSCTIRYVGDVDFEDQVSDIIQPAISEAFCFCVAAYVYAVLNDTNMAALMEAKRNALLG